MHPAVTCTEDEEIRAIAERIVTKSVNHIVVVDETGKLQRHSHLMGRHPSNGRRQKSISDIETHNVFTAKPDEPLEVASKRMAQHNISALPVIDIEKKVLGIVTSEDVSKLLRKEANMVRILLRFSEEQVSEPIASQIIIEYKVPMAILSAQINSKGGEILAEVPESSKKKSLKPSAERGISVNVPKLIEVDNEKCFSCGACVALCPVEAISIDKDYTIQFQQREMRRQHMQHLR